MIFSSRNGLSLIVLSAIMMLPSTAFAQTFSVEYDVDRGGSDYKNFDVQGGHEVCRDACAGDANCKAYTYTKPYQGSAAHCFLKSAVPNPVPYRSCCISGVKGAAFGGNDAMGAREDNTGLQGTTLSYYHRPAFETCQSDCVNNGNCKGFTWIQAGMYNANDPAMCYLMSAVTGRSQARGHYSGIKGATSGGGGGNNTGGAFAGKWRAYGWEFIYISQNGNSVTGSYSTYNDRPPIGQFTGRVEGDKLYFSWTNNDGAPGEAYLYQFAQGRWGLRSCPGRGCDPVNARDYSEAFKQ